MFDEDEETYINDKFWEENEQTQIKC